MYGQYKDTIVKTFTVNSKCADINRQKTGKIMAMKIKQKDKHNTQNSTMKTKAEQHEPYKKGFRFSRSVSNSSTTSCKRNSKIKRGRQKSRKTDKIMANKIKRK